MEEIVKGLLAETYTYTSSNGKTYYLNKTVGSNNPRYYFGNSIKSAVPEIPEGFKVIEGRGGLPLLKKKG